jgi:hypothetical protein
MMRSLAVATLALSLIAFGGACDDEDDGGTGGRGGSGGAGGSAGRGGSGGTGGATGGTGGATGGTGGATGGTGGATGGTGGATGGTGGSTGGTGGGGDAADMASMEGGAETGAEAGGETGAANICSTYVAGSGALANISAADFCAEYMATCTYSAGTYADLADCMTKYGGTAMANKTCRAGHLCNAKAAMGASRTTHCGHSAGMAPCM